MAEKSTPQKAHEIKIWHMRLLEALMTASDRTDPNKRKAKIAIESAAATYCGVTRGGVMKAIQKMEAALEVKLLSFVGSRYRLTQEGEAVYFKMRELFTKFEEL